MPLHHHNLVPKGRLFGRERPHPTDEGLVLRKRKLVCNCGKEKTITVEQLKPSTRSPGRPQNFVKPVSD
jgi:hypothetical protein